jgi:DNA-directed RNA polymerase specialized sigma subunit
MHPGIKGQFKKTSELKGPASFEKWKASPTDDNLYAVLKEVEPAVASSINAHAGGDKAYKTKARVLAVEAIKNYDPTRGAALNTHVYNHLRRLNRIRAQRQNALHFPEQIHTDRRVVDEFTKEYTDIHGVEPSDTAIADGLSMSIDRINRTRLKEAPTSRALSDKGDLAGKARSQSDIWMDYVYFDLGEKDKKILEWTTGYNGSKRLSKKEIAAKLGISQPAISQRVSKIVQKLEEVNA